MIREYVTIHDGGCAAIVAALNMNDMGLKSLNQGLACH